jgi:hypothetical protein
MRMRYGILLERVLDVDYKMVFYISINDPLESLIDVVHFDDLSLRINSFRATEVNHFLDVLGSSSNTAN